MKIKVIRETKNYNYTVKFRIESIEEDEILRIAMLSPIEVNMDPKKLGFTIVGATFPIGGSLLLKLRNIGEGTINWDDLNKYEFTFADNEQAEKFAQVILEQFNNEIQRIKKLDTIVAREETYETKSDEGIKKIYAGAKKLLDENSEEYKEIVEKNLDAWKKLAEL